MDTQYGIETQGLETQFLYNFICGQRYGKDNASSKGKKAPVSDNWLMGKGNANGNLNNGDTGKVVTFPSGWTNGIIALFEPAPVKRPRNWDRETQDQVLDNSHLIKNFEGIRTSSNGRELYPMFCAPWLAKDTLRANAYNDTLDNYKTKIIRFDDTSGNEYWFDGRYVGAMLKRCNLSQPVKFSMDTFSNSAVLVVSQNGKVTGFVSGMFVDDVSKNKIYNRLVTIRARKITPPMTATELTETAKPVNATTAPLPETNLELPGSVIELTTTVSAEIPKRRLDIRSVEKSHRKPPVLIGASPKREKSDSPAFLVVTTGQWGQAERIREVYT